MKKELRELAADLAGHLKTLDEDTVAAPHISGKCAFAPEAGAGKTADGGIGEKPEVRSQKSDRLLTAVLQPLTSKPPPSLSAVTEQVKAAMEELSAEVKTCRKCPLGHARLNAVFGVGSLEAKVVFVGEGPGYEEDHRGEPFVGRSGKLLDKILATVLGLSREQVYIANIVKCHPMKDPEHPDSMGNDRPPSPEEISACRPYLEKQLALIKPKCVVTLGSVAAKLILGETRGISLLRGKWYDYPGGLFTSQKLKVLPTYHPAALLRNPNLKRDTWEDMKLLKAFLSE
jgi:DNA polymerase